MASLKVILVCVVVFALLVETFATPVDTTDDGQDGATDEGQKHRRRVKKIGDNAGIIKSLAGGVQGFLNGAINAGTGILGDSGLIGGFLTNVGDLGQGIINGTANIVYSATDEAGKFANQAKDKGKAFITGTTKAP